jgi:hypothetical protein
VRSFCAGAEYCSQSIQVAFHIPSRLVGLQGATDALCGSRIGRGLLGTSRACHNRDITSNISANAIIILTVIVDDSLTSVSLLFSDVGDATDMLDA